MTAQTGDETITYENHIHHWADYHGERQTVEIADRGDAMVWCVIPLNSEIPLDPHMISGRYQKQVNSQTVADEVIVHCNDDWSFSITEHTGSIVNSIAALQAAVNALLGQTHSHP